jgi:hypothetical protein
LIFSFQQAFKSVISFNKRATPDVTQYGGNVGAEYISEKEQVLLLRYPNITNIQVATPGVSRLGMSY